MYSESFRISHENNHPIPSHMKQPILLPFHSTSSPPPPPPSFSSITSPYPYLNPRPPAILPTTPPHCRKLCVLQPKKKRKGLLILSLHHENWSDVNTYLEHSSLSLLHLGSGEWGIGNDRMGPWGIGVGEALMHPTNAIPPVVPLPLPENPHRQIQSAKKILRYRDFVIAGIFSTKVVIPRYTPSPHHRSPFSTNNSLSSLYPL